MRPLRAVASVAVLAAVVVGVTPTGAGAAPGSAATTSTTSTTSLTTRSGGDPVPADSVYAGPAAGQLAQVDLGVRASAAGVPYVGNLVLEPTSITNYDLFAGGITVNATGLGGSQRALITDTSPSGEVYTFDPVQTDATGSVTTSVRRADRIDPEVGVHRIEVTTDDGRQAGALLEVTLSERLNAQAVADPAELSADAFHDSPVIIRGSGFQPNEWVSAHYTTPDGDMGLLAAHLIADAEGNVAYALQAASAAATPGPWQVTFLGMATTRAGIATILVTPSPANIEVGALSIRTDPLTTDSFVTGMEFAATGLPAFGLFDLEVQDPDNRKAAVGRFRANGDGLIADALVGDNVPAGHYRLTLTNADTADYVSTEFDVTNPDGTLPVRPTMTVDPTSIDSAQLMADGITVTADGFDPGATVAIALRDHYRQVLRPALDVVAAKQADDDGAVTFTFRARTAAAAGAWEVAVATTTGSGLIQRAGLTVRDPGAPVDDPGQSEPTNPTPETPVGGTPPTTAVPPTADDLLGTGPRSWFVRIAGDGALAYDQQAAEDGEPSAGVAPSAEDRVESLEATTEDIVEEAADQDDDARTLYESVWTVPGVAIHTTSDVAAQLAERSDVVSVTPITPKQVPTPLAGSETPLNGPSDQLTGALDTWVDTGYTGEGVTIAVVDTGVDYTHADFGGPGEDGYPWVEAGTTYADAMPPEDSGLYDADVIAPGYDFAGGLYNADPTSSAFFPIPVPDTNPIDGPGGGHGTHVAGTAAGRGVTADGETFDGDYTTLDATDLDAMTVAPGSAPGATIVPLKVFGDNGGSTDLAGAALDWIGGQIAQGNQIDVVNMSLGSSFTAVDDPENDQVKALTDLGVVVVISAGNSGDVTDVAGSPGNAESSLAVAASRSGFVRYDAVEALAPADVAGDWNAQFSVEWPLGTIDNTGPVGAPSAANATGCGAFSAEDRAALAGHMVWLEWDEAAVAAGTECGSSTRFLNAQAAGAVGVLLTSTSEQFEGGIAGNQVLAGAQLSKSSSDALRPAMADGTLVVRIAGENAQVNDEEDPSLADTLADFSSRGVHGSVDDVVKPDVSAPGVNVISAGMGSGTGSKSESGTSMAAPHTAGIAALARQAHPDWSAQRIKTVLMNTATTPVLVGVDAPVSSPLRSGTGRIDAPQAVDSEVTVASADNGDLVTASFGVVEVGAGGVTESRPLTLENSGTQDVTYDVGYTERTATPGAGFSVDSTSVTVPAGGTAQVTVTLSVPDAGQLRRTVDPGTDQSTDAHIADVSGNVTFTPSGAAGVPLSVVAFAAPKPVAALLAGEPTVFDDPTDPEADLELQGTALSQGSGDDAYTSRVTPLVAGPVSERVEQDGASEDSLTGADILVTGAASTAPNETSPAQGTLAIGIGLAGPVLGVGATTFPVALLDANRDGRDDFALRPRMDAAGVATVAAYDLGTGIVLGTQPLNGLTGHTNQFDNDTIVLPVDLAVLGYTDTTVATSLAYRASTISYYAPVALDGSSIVDVTERAVFDVYDPPVSFRTGDGTAVEGSEVTVQQGSEGAGELLLVAHDNATGSRVLTSSWRTGGEVTVTGIEVTEMPARTEYAIGQPFDPAGLVVSAVSSDGSRRALAPEDYTVSAVDTSVAGPVTVQIDATIDGVAHTTAFTVTVVPPGTTPTDPGTPADPGDPGTPGTPGSPGDPQTPADPDGDGGGWLANTGLTGTLTILGVGLALLAAGVVLLVAQRRRRAARIDA